MCSCEVSLSGLRVKIPQGELLSSVSVSVIILYIIFIWICIIFYCGQLYCGFHHCDSAGKLTIVSIRSHLLDDGSRLSGLLISDCFQMYC